MIIASLASITASAIIGIFVSALYNPTLTVSNYTLNSTIGRPCSSSGDCIANAYCLMASQASVGICSCVTSYYFDTATSACLTRVTAYQPCTYDYQCLEYKRLKCTSGTCQCPSTMFWNSTYLECQFLKVPYSICTSTGSNTECISNAVCWPTPSSIPVNKCICGTMWYNYYWWWYNPTTGLCEYKSYAGSPCTYDRQCVDFAYCTYTAASPNQKICVCDSMYYRGSNNQCNQKITSLNGGYGWGTCSYIDQCNLNENNLRCINGICQCDLISEYWDTYFEKCMPLKTYGQTCGLSVASSNCISGFSCLTPNAGGARKACLCTTSQYFDWVSGTCQTLKTYNAICNSRFECSNQVTMVCLGTNGGATKRCLCAPNYAYASSSTVCSLKVTSGSACTSTQQCQDYLGFICTSGTCQCSSGRYYDAVSLKCIPVRSSGDYCSAANQCGSGVCSGNLCT